MPLKLQLKKHSASNTLKKTFSFLRLTQKEISPTQDLPWVGLSIAYLYIRAQRQVVPSNVRVSEAKDVFDNV
jgi:hypothetical protein